MAAMEGGIETGDLEKLGVGAQERADRGEIVGLVQGARGTKVSSCASTSASITMGAA